MSKKCERCVWKNDCYDLDQSRCKDFVDRELAARMERDAYDREYQRYLYEFDHDVWFDVKSVRFYA